MSVRFNSNSFTDLLLFSGMEFNDSQLKKQMGENYYSINPETDFTHFKRAYSQHRAELNWDYSKFISVVSRHFDVLVSPETPQVHRDIVTHKIVAFTKQEMLTQRKPSGIFDKLFGINNTSKLRRMYAGSHLAREIETRGRYIPQVQQCFENCKGVVHRGKRFYRCTPPTEELCGRIKELDEKEFNRFISDVFFKYVYSCRWDCNRKLKLLSHFSPAQKALLLDKLIQRDDWFLILHDMMRHPKIGQDDRIEQHRNLIAELNDDLFIKAFNKDMEKVVSFRKELIEDDFERIVGGGYKKYFARMLMEKALKIYLNKENTSQLTRLVKMLESEECLPQTCCEVKDNLLALMFSKPIFLEEKEIEKLKKILPDKLHQIHIIEWD